MWPLTSTAAKNHDNTLTKTQTGIVQIIYFSVLLLMSILITIRIQYPYVRTWTLYGANLKYGIIVQ